MGLSHPPQKQLVLVSVSSQCRQVSLPVWLLSIRFIDL
jgi:hypothetical protein